VEPFRGSAVLLYCPPLKVVLIQLLDVQLKAAVALYAIEPGAVNEGTQAGVGTKFRVNVMVAPTVPQFWLLEGLYPVRVHCEPPV